MSGKKGRSGRLPLNQEIERARVRQLAWTVTGQYLDSKGPLKERATVAVGVVKADMAKPINAYVINNNDQTTNIIEKVEFKNKSDKDIIDFLTGRHNGTVTPEPVRKS